VTALQVLDDWLHGIVVPKEAAAVKVRHAAPTSSQGTEW
jgi:hypothetical protein